MKTLTTILILLTTAGFAQDYYINLEWPKQNVKAQNRELELIWSAKDYLEYKVPGGYIAYEFENRICVSASICLDSIAGCELIELHEFKNWQPTGLNRWDYYAGYDEHVHVTADWFGGNVIFRYTLKD